MDEEHLVNEIRLFGLFLVFLTLYDSNLQCGGDGDGGVAGGDQNSPSGTNPNQLVFTNMS